LQLKHPLRVFRADNAFELVTFIPTDLELQMRSGYPVESEQATGWKRSAVANAGLDSDHCVNHLSYLASLNFPLLTSIFDLPCSIH
jgi:hypothetical protein